MDFRCPNIQAYHNYAVICLNFGTPKMINFPFGTNGKLIILVVPILKHITVVFKVHVHDVWMDGWLTCDLTSFSTVHVFQLYQDDERLIMTGGVQWNLLYS